MLINKKQSAFYQRIFHQREMAYNTSETILFSKEIIPCAKKFNVETLKTIKKHKLAYYIFNDIQKQDEMNAYLITITNTNKMSHVTTFTDKLKELKRKKGFENLEFYYYATVEPTKKGEPHIHIKLVISKIRGVATKLREFVQELGFSLTHMKKQGIDKKNYLLKTLIKENYKEYTGWLDTMNISLNKAVKRSMYIKINDELSITLNDYKLVLKTILKDNSKDYVGIKEIKAYLNRLMPLYKRAYEACKNKEKKNKETKFQVTFNHLKNSFTKLRLLMILWELSQTVKVVKSTYKIPRISYSIYNQVVVLNLVLILIDLRNNSPTNL